VTHFWNFGTPLISRERLKLETSNLARRRTSVTSNQKNAKLCQKGSCGGHVTHFWNFGTPLISRERLEIETSNLARRRTAVSSNKKKTTSFRYELACKGHSTEKAKNAKLGQNGSCGGHVTHFWNFGTP